MTQNKKQGKEQIQDPEKERNEQYIRATFTNFFSGNPTYVIRDENGCVIAMAMDEPVIKSAQRSILEKTNKYYAIDLVRMTLKRVEEKQ